MEKLTILDELELDEISMVLIDSWATLQSAKNGRALFQVPGGLLVFNLSDPTTPFAQAFFATRGWPNKFHVTDDLVMFAAGRYGIYQFGLDKFNLISE